MIKNSSHSISKKDISVVKRVLLKQDLTQGEEILKFEKNISKFTKANYASVVNSSTSALLIACKALNLKKGDYFWTSAISFVASANCAELLGAHVGFVDISLNDFNIDIKSLEKRLKNTKKNKIPKILVVVHYAGNSCNMKEIYKLSKIYGFKIIEDSCHALGGSYLSYRIGSCKYSHISTFSFHAIKNICAGEGGAITTNYNWIKKRVDFFRSHGILKKKNHVSWMYDQVNIGYNFRLTDFQAAMANNQLKRIKSIIKKKWDISETYNKYLNKDKFILPKQNINSGLHLYVIRIKNFTLKKKIMLTKNIFSKFKILLNFHYKPIYRHSYYKKKYNYKNSLFKNSEIFFKEAISLPFHLNLNNKDCIYISKSLDKLIKS